MTVRLWRDAAAAPAAARRVAAILLTAAHPDDGLEHVYAQPSSSGIDVIAFLVAPAPSCAEAATRALVARAERAALSGYHVVRCQVNRYRLEFGPSADGGL